jgi:hypothetical protein
MISCTGMCVAKYILAVGNILNQIWNSPLRQIFEDLLRQPQLTKFPSKQ